jgi:hypothetical protein
MRQSLKIAISLLASLLLFAGFAVFAFSGLFNVLQTSFFLPRIEASYRSQLTSLADSIDKFHQTNLLTFQGIAKKDYITEAFAQSPSPSAIQSLKSLATDLQLFGVRLIGPDGKRIFFSSFLDIDVKQQTANSTAWKNYNEDGSLIPFAGLSAAAEKGKVLIDDGHSVFVYALPVSAAGVGTAQAGTLVMYVKPNDLLSELAISNIYPVANLALIGTQGILIGEPGTSPAVVTGLQAIWGHDTTDESFTAPLSLVTKDGTATGYRVFSSRLAHGGLATIVIPSVKFEMGDLMKGMLFVTFFFTVFLLIYLMLNLKSDPLEVLRQRVKRFQIELISELVESPGGADWGKWRREMEARKDEITWQIQRGIGRVSNKQKPVIDEYMSKSWSEIIELISRRSETPTALAPGALDMSRLEALIQAALQNANFVLPAARVSQVPGPRVEEINVSDVIEASPEAQSTHQAPKAAGMATSSAEAGVEEIEAVEEAEPAEEVEEAESVEEAETVEEAESAEEAEAVEDAEPVEEAEAVEDAEPVEEAEAVEDAEPVEEAEAVGETESVEEVEPVGEAMAAEAVEEAESVEEAEAVGESESVEEAETVEEAGPSEEAEGVGESESVEEAETVEEAGPAEEVEAVEEAEALEALDVSDETAVASTEAELSEEQGARTVPALDGSSGTNAESQSADDEQTVVDDDAESFGELEPIEEEPAASATVPLVSSFAGTGTERSVISDFIEIRIPSRSLDGESGMQSAATKQEAEILSEVLEELEPLADILPLPPEPVEEGLELLPSADEEQRVQAKAWEAGIMVHGDEEEEEPEELKEIDMSAPAKKPAVQPQKPAEDLTEFEELESVDDEEFEAASSAAATTSDADMKAELDSLVAAGAVRSFAIEELQKMVEEGKSAIVMENGVFRIKEDVYSSTDRAREMHEDKGLRELAQEVVHHGETPATPPEGARGGGEEQSFGGIGDLMKDEDALDLSKVIASEKGPIPEAAFPVDKEKINPMLLKRNGLDYDEFLASYPRSFTHTVQMKSLVEVSRRVSAVSGSILLKKVQGYASDLTVGMNEKTVQSFKFDVSDPFYSLFLMSRKAVVFEKNPSEIHLLSSRFDSEDLRYMKRLLFIPVIFRGQEAYLFLSFSGETEIAIDSILSKLIVE